MDPQFAYSFDRARFHGSFPTRQDAVRAAEARLEAGDIPAEAIYVGRRVAQPSICDGLADAVLERLCANADAAGLELPRLSAVDDQTHARLESELSACVGRWLGEHGLLPRVDCYERISEHPVPQPKLTARPPQPSEVSLMGLSDD